MKNLTFKQRQQQWKCSSPGFKTGLHKATADTRAATSKFYTVCVKLWAAAPWWAMKVLYVRSMNSNLYIS